MGSEHSSQQGKAVRSGLRRGKSVPEYRVEEENKNRGEGNTGTISPEPSVCSDSDLPYISYTVNRPIGGETLFLLILNAFWIDVQQFFVHRFPQKETFSETFQRERKFQFWIIEKIE